MIILTLLMSMTQTDAQQESDLDRAAAQMNEAADGVFAMAGADVSKPSDRKWILEQKASPTGAKRWVTVSESSQGITALQVRDFLSGPVSTVWFRVGASNYGGDDSSLMQERVDCPNRTTTIVRMVVHRKDGTVALDQGTPPNKQETQTVVPGSSGEKMLEAVCG